ncbi:type II toxin-antitoxin system RelE family toxin [Adlercreutzia caecimuris]|uniref:type II toxin-antitoxin system RelE family toxin n=1 Tax=Adlercreutzia caecimuris TaxID=671266 RepID=UPI0024942601|nr:hypothetical protein [Adlercreutzia caecimuris]
MSGRFTLAFIDEDARKEYRKLDGSTKRFVDVGLRKLEERADELGAPLRGALAGCKKLKWRDAGIRLVFRILDGGTVEIVETVAIGRRDKDAVCKIAEGRLGRL